MTLNKKSYLDESEDLLNMYTRGFGKVFWMSVWTIYKIQMFNSY